jgi:hypothetical protein
MTTADENKRDALAALYRRTPSDELARRIAAGSLVPEAHAAAVAELRERSERDDAGLPRAAPTTPERHGGLLLGNLAIAVGALVGAIAMPYAGFEILFVVTLLTMAALLGKRYPRLGLTLGIVLALLPFALGAWAWRHGELSFRGADFQPLGALLAWGVLIVISILAWSFASVLIDSARRRAIAATGADATAQALAVRDGKSAD